MLANPDSAKVSELDSELAALETQITSLLDRQVVQTPGQLVIMDSSELSGVQTLVRTLRNLGIVLPILVVLLYLAALFLAKGWRREALIAAGGGIVAATLFVLVVRRLAGNEVTSLASSETVEPAVQAVWDIISVSLRDRARFVLVVGVVFIAGGVFAGPGRYAISARRFIAPFLRQHPVAVYSIVAVLFLLWLAFMPGIDTIGQVISILVLAALAALGVAPTPPDRPRVPAPGSPGPAGPAAGSQQLGAGLRRSRIGRSAGGSCRGVSHAHPNPLGSLGSGGRGAPPPPPARTPPRRTLHRRRQLLFGRVAGGGAPGPTEPSERADSGGRGKPPDRTRPDGHGPSTETRPSLRQPRPVSPPATQG